jgi:hypothetical protein
MELQVTLNTDVWVLHLIAQNIAYILFGLTEKEAKLVPSR